MSVLRSLAALLALGVVQIFLPQVWSGFGVVDWLLIYIVVEALRSSFQRSTLLGAGGGLIQDGLAGGILGLHAFAKTSVAALIAAFTALSALRRWEQRALRRGRGGRR